MRGGVDAEAGPEALAEQALTRQLGVALRAVVAAVVVEDGRLFVSAWPD